MDELINSIFEPLVRLLLGFLFFCIVTGSASNLWVVMDFPDMMILGMAFPNILGMLFMVKELRSNLISNWDRWKSGNLYR